MQNKTKFFGNFSLKKIVSEFLFIMSESELRMGLPTHQEFSKKNLYNLSFIYGYFTFIAPI